MIKKIFRLSKKRICYYILGTTLYAFLLGVVLQTRIDLDSVLQGIQQDFQTTFDLKTEESRLVNNAYRSALPSLNNIFQMREKLDYAETKQMYTTIYKGSQLYFWSSANTVFDRNSYGIVIQPNGIYYCLKVQTQEFIIITGFLIKHRFEYGQTVLDNDFQEDFEIESNVVELSFSSEETNSPIVDESNTQVFSLEVKNEKALLAQGYVLSSFVFFVAFTLLLICLYLFQQVAVRKLRRIFFQILFLLGFYATFYTLQVPQAWFFQDIFSTMFFQPSIMFPSLGMVIIAIMIVSFTILSIFNARDVIPVAKSRPTVLFYLVLFLVSTAVHFYSVKTVIGSYDFNKTLFQATLKGESILSLIILALLTFQFSFVFVLFYRVVPFKNHRKNYFIWGGIILIVAAIVTIIFEFFFFRILLLYISFIVIRITCTLFIRKRFIWKWIFLFFLSSSVNGFFINKTFNEKNNQIKQALATEYAQEMGSELPSHLERIIQNIKLDPAIIRGRYDNVLSQYIKYTYLQEIATNYKTQVVACRTNSCQNLINKVLEQGENISNSLYSLSNKQNYTAYYAIIQLSRFILIIEVSPALQVSRNTANILDQYLEHSKSSYTEYSFAYYKNNELTSSKGTYLFPPNGEVFSGTNEEFESLVHNQYRHMVYKFSENERVVIATNNILWTSTFFSIIYLNIIEGILLVVYLVVFGYITLKFSLPQKIHIGLLFTLGAFFISLFIFILGRNKRSLEEEGTTTMQYALQLLSSNLEEIVGSWNNSTNSLQNILHRQASLLRKGINLYDQNGHLITSSDPFIFQTELQSSYMNPRAYYELLKGYRQVILSENIGSQTYKGGYTLLYDKHQNPYLYIHVTSLDANKEIRSDLWEVSIELLQLFASFYLLFLPFSALIVRLITSPLRRVEKNIQAIELGNPTVQLSYNRNDALGTLVESYSHKIDELDKASKQLARQERELAWREMAKQVVHEIKNPLTSMKLSIQHMQRIVSGPNEKFQEAFAKNSKMMIEQIDNLDAIASVFSEYARLPQPDNQVFNVIDTLKGTVELMQNNSKTEQLILKTHPHTNLPIYGDKSFISRVLINLIKNSFQAIPEGRMGVVEIFAMKAGGNCIIEVRDNGEGIPNNVKPKLFAPHFTTKTSNSGLGLAICKKIVEDAGGTIQYQTKQNEGTSFFITLPLHY